MCLQLRWKRTVFTIFVGLFHLSRNRKNVNCVIMNSVCVDLNYKRDMTALLLDQFYAQKAWITVHWNVETWLIIRFSYLKYVEFLSIFILEIEITNAMESNQKVSRKKKSNNKIVANVTNAHDLNYKQNQQNFGM